jgi:hypothetical protein
MRERSGADRLQTRVGHRAKMVRYDFQATPPNSGVLIERKTMKTYAVTVPEIAIVAATRGVAGAGIGLLVADFLRPDTRRTLGWTLLTIGALTTIPIAMALFGKRETSTPSDASTEVAWHSEIS